jgi:CTP:molybdopterin cytidylyltransferase MocA
MQLIVPMAGLGKRFADAGFLTPKPLIQVAGLPMVVRVVRDLPPADRLVFVVHGDHVREFAIDSELRRHLPGAEVVVSPGLTAGQACTVRLAADAIDLDDDVLVAACDATHVYDAARFDALRRDQHCDAAVWTYRGEPRVLATPRSFGWIDCGHEEATAGEMTNRQAVDPVIRRVSCKQPISDKLLSDRVASGFFWFRSGRTMIDAIDRLVAGDNRVNNEFYLDVVPNLLIAAGLCVRAFDVDKYIGWGTPEDLREYQHWQRYFASASVASTSLASTSDSTKFALRQAS